MKALVTPALLLAGLLALSALNCRAMESDVLRWQSQLETAEDTAASGNWAGALDLLCQSYGDWSTRQTYLHIVAEHAAVDGADAMYRRAAAFAATEEASEFRSELADLRHQLGLLAEMEQFSIRNIL